MSYQVSNKKQVFGTESSKSNLLIDDYQQFTTPPRTINIPTRNPSKFTTKQENAWIPPSKRKDVNQSSPQEAVCPKSKEAKAISDWKTLLLRYMNNIAERLFDEYSVKVIEICEKLCKDDFEDAIEVICTKGIESSNKIQMTCIGLLKSIKNDAKTANQFDGCLEAVYGKYFCQKSKRQVTLHSIKQKMSEQKTTGDLYESHEVKINIFEENIFIFYGNILKEGLICNEFGREIANQLIDMKQDIAIRKACIFIEHAGKQFSKNNKQLIFAIQKYGKNSQLPIRDKFKIMNLTDLVGKKWNIDLSTDDIIVTSKVPKHSSIEEAKTGAKKNENPFTLEKISSRIPLSATSALETEPTKNAAFSSSDKLSALETEPTKNTALSSSDKLSALETEPTENKIVTVGGSIKPVEKHLAKKKRATQSYKSKKMSSNSKLPRSNVLAPKVDETSCKGGPSSIITKANSVENSKENAVTMAKTNSTASSSKTHEKEWKTVLKSFLSDITSASYDRFSTKIFELVSQFGREDLEEVVNIICSVGAKSGEDVNIFSNLLKSLRTQTSKVKNFDLEAYLGSLNKKCHAIKIEDEPKPLLNMNDSEFFGTLLKEGLVPASNGKEVIELMIKSKQDSSIARSCTLLTCAGKNFAEQNKHIITDLEILLENPNLLSNTKNHILRLMDLALDVWMISFDLDEEELISPNKGISKESNCNIVTITSHDQVKSSSSDKLSALEAEPTENEMITIGCSENPVQKELARKKRPSQSQIPSGDPFKDHQDLTKTFVDAPIQISKDFEALQEPKEPNPVPNKSYVKKLIYGGSVLLAVGTIGLMWFIRKK